MPVFNSRTAFEVARGIKAYLNVEAGLTRGEIPAPAKASQVSKAGAAQGPPALQARELEQELARLKAKLASYDSGTGIGPENIVWIFCSNRSGSTWLGSMMGDIEGYEMWNEPLVGKLFGDLYYQGAEGHKDRETYILGISHKASWLNSVQSFVLSEAGARYPEAAADTQPDAWVRRRAQNHVRHAGKAKEAYEVHQGPKVLIRYEELRADTLGTMRRLYSTLGLPFGEDELARAVEKHAWENIPEEEKGEGKFYRKATPGGWREDLTPEQAKIVEQVSAPLLKEFYPG